MTTTRRLAAALVALLVALVALGAGSGAPAGAAVPGSTAIVGAVGYDRPGPTGRHRLILAPEHAAAPITGITVEQWDATGTTKLATYDRTGAALDPTITLEAPDGVTFQYRARSRNADGWGPFGGFEAVATEAGAVYHQPFATELDLIERQLFDFFGPETGNAAGYWWGWIDDEDDVASFLDHLATSETRAARMRVVRLYLAFFARGAEPAGLFHWEHQLESGAASLTKVANAFAGSPEFKAMYGGTTNAQFVHLVYQNVLFRSPAPAEVAYWKGQLDQGLASRGKVMVGFSESAEGRHLRRGDAAVADLWATMVRKPATDAVIDTYSPYVEAGGRVGNLALALLPLDAYVAYYGD